MTLMSDSGSLATLLAFIFPGHSEWLVLLVLGLLIFGRRLPEVGRSLGRSIVEFKRGIKGIEDEVETESSTSAGTPRLDQSTTADENRSRERLQEAGTEAALEPPEKLEKVEAGGGTDPEDTSD